MKYKKSILERKGFYKITQCLTGLKRLNEIIAESGVNSATARKLLYEMMDEVLVEKIIDPIDRKPKYRLTTKGKEYKDKGKEYKKIIKAITVLEKSLKELEKGEKINSKDIFSSILEKIS